MKISVENQRNNGQGYKEDQEIRCMLIKYEMPLCPTIRDFK